MAKQEIWFDDLAAFVAPEHITKIWWTKSDDPNAAMNSILRFCIMYSIVACVVTLDTWPIIIPVLVAFFTYLIHKNNLWPSSISDWRYEQFAPDKPSVTLPTIDNPVMNFLPADYAHPDKPPAANVLDADIKRQMSDAYDAGLPGSAKDIFGRNSSERCFYTMPVTGCTNDAVEFARWLFPPSSTADWKESAVVRGFQSSCAS